MSVKITSWAWDQAIQNPKAKLVLLALADWANPEGVCWPSKEALAEKTGLSKRTVDTHIQELLGAGLITLQGQSKRRQDGRGGRNIYTVGPGCKNCTPDKAAGVQIPTIPGCKSCTAYKVEPSVQQPSVQQTVRAPNPVPVDKSQKEYPKPYLARNCEERAMAAYRICKLPDNATDKDHRAWDRENYSGWIKANHKFLRAFGVEHPKGTDPEDLRRTNMAIDYISDHADKMKSIGITDWKFRGLAQKAWEDAALLPLRAGRNGE